MSEESGAGKVAPRHARKAAAGEPRAQGDEEKRRPKAARRREAGVRGKMPAKVRLFDAGKGAARKR